MEGITIIREYEAKIDDKKRTIEFFRQYGHLEHIPAAEREVEQMEIIKAALEKQIPKDVIVHEQIRDGKTTRIDLECPACGFWQDERHIKFHCPNCGQRIK
jgi:rubrerythrin